MSKAVRSAGAGCVVLLGIGVCFVAAMQSLGEGPHGPDGDITWAPGQGQEILVLGAIGIGLFIIGAKLLKRINNEERQK